MTNQAPSKRVTLEENKVRQTTHWDMDYLPLKEVERLHTREGAPADEATASVPRAPRASNRRIGLICIATGAGLLVLTLAIVRWVV